MLRVHEAAFATVQDAGRPGWERFGVPPGGPMDWLALRAANDLVGNPPAAAALELALGSLTLESATDALIALTGAGFGLFVDGRSMPVWSAVRMRAGQIIQVVPLPTTPGVWAYLAICGGVAVEPVLGSRSTYLRGGLGGWNGRLLQPGDKLPVDSCQPDWERAGCRVRPNSRPAYATQITARVVLGPQEDWFTPQAVQRFLSQEYTLGSLSDRMGSRLQGSPLQQARSGDLLSEGMVTGAVQVPPDGQPIVMMPDRPVSGGYPKIATVIRADQPLLAQLRPGEGCLRFQAVTIEEARLVLRMTRFLIETIL